MFSLHARARLHARPTLLRCVNADPRPHTVSPRLPVSAHTCIRATTVSKCDAPGCTKQKYYAPAFGQPARYCGAHSPLDWVNVVNKRCAQDGCTHIPIFGHSGGKPSRCATHASPDMVDVVSKQCGVKGCTKQPSYGLPIAGNKPSRCATHATDKMIDLNVYLCKIEGCPTTPSFAKPGFKASRCAAHAQRGMVDVVSKRCDAPGCTKQPSFGPAVGQRQTKCAAHAPPHWRDVVSRRCDSPAPNVCDKHPSYGFPGAGARRCAGHAEQGMIDVRSKRCEAPGCGTTQPTYGPPGGPRKNCAGHTRARGMSTWRRKRSRRPKLRPSRGGAALNNRPINRPICFGVPRLLLGSIPGPSASQCVLAPIITSCTRTQNTATGHTLTLLCSPYYNCTSLLHRYALLFTHALFPNRRVFQKVAPCLCQLAIVDAGRPARCSNRYAHGARLTGGACSSLVSLPRARN